MNDNNCTNSIATSISIVINNTVFRGNEGCQVTTIGFRNNYNPRNFFPSIPARKSIASLNNGKKQELVSKSFRLSRMCISNKKFRHSDKQKVITSIDKAEVLSDDDSKSQEKKRIEGRKKIDDLKLETKRKAKKYLKECAIRARSIIQDLITKIPNHSQRRGHLKVQQHEIKN